MINLLTEPLPDSLLICGKEYALDTDWRSWVRFELLVTETDLPDERLYLPLALGLVFPDEQPPMTEETLAAVMSFYRGGDLPDNCAAGQARQSRRRKRIYSYEYDSGYIYAAFLQQYSIDLRTAQLHWWLFRALFHALTEDVQMVKIMGYRSMTIDKGMTDRMREHYKELKANYKLPLTASEAEKLEEMKRKLKGG